MHLSDLRLETHHRGFQLAVKRASPVVTLSTRSWTMVQDDAGETERLEIVLHKTRHGRELLESSSSFVLKEPYFTLTEEGEATLRVDHPSDLVIQYQHDECQPKALSPAKTEATALSYKQKGSSALQQGNLPLAHHYYTTALTLLTTTPSPITSTLTYDLHRNRAHVNLLLGNFTSAKSDVLAALIPTTADDDDPHMHMHAAELNSKSYFRAATAAYNLRQFAEARSLFEKQLALTPADKRAVAAANINLARTKARLMEERDGVYDFTALRAASFAGGQGTGTGEVDAASFVRYTEVRESPGRGRGLFSLRDVAAGEVIMVEKGYCVVQKGVQTAVTFDVRDERIRVAAVGLERSVVERLMGNPEEIGAVMDLFGDWEGGEGKGVYGTDDGPVVDVFRVHDIVARNAFGMGERGAGLWMRAAYINHSCIPNAEREFVGDLMVLRATRDIAAGEEIVHSYDESGDYDARRETLQATWGFGCDCALCVAEKGDDVAVREKRRKLMAEADAFVESVSWPAKRLAILKAQRLAKEIDGTYEGEKFKGLPRLASRGIRQWLVKATSGR
jgi:tetratricopeptide (TPR) repeat protein